MRPLRQPADPIPLSDRAIENLTFIRETMERATTVTSVPGWGGAAMGLTALAASALAARQPTRDDWVLVWLVEVIVALAIGGATMVRKAERTGASLKSRAGRLFAGAFIPPVVAGAALTAGLYRVNETALLPAVWLLLYGTAVTVAGLFSIRVVPIMGACFMALGVAAFWTPPSWGDLMMGIGFGGLHLVFGVVIARRYGG
jgi:hypothetical protein